MSKLNLGIIGTGLNTINYILAIQRNPLLNLSIISDGNIRYACDLTKGMDCSVCDNDYNIIYNDNIDAVIISTSYKRQIEIAKLCIIAQKHVLLDKIIASPKQILDLYDLAQEKGIVIYVGLFKRHHSDYMAIKEKLSNIKSIYSVNKKPLQKPYRTSNGLIGEMIYYDLDIILNYLDYKMPNKILAISNTNHKELKKVKEYESMDIKLIYDTGLIINISSSRNSTYGFDDRIEIESAEGLTKIKNQSLNNIVQINNEGLVTSYTNNNYYIRYKQSYFYMLDYFHKIIFNKMENTVQRDNILKLNKICQIVNKSLEEKNVTRVGGIMKNIVKM